MNTKTVPALVMLTAGFVTCIIGIKQDFSFETYVKTLFLVLVGFYIFGIILKVILDKGFRNLDEPLSEFEALEIDEDLMDDLAMLDDEYEDEFFDR
ncbi:MAG: hypothetical protein J6B28_03305 [Eubacterium sp.]|nr:hypothetical protein [Eubacterium sp.]